MIDAPNENCPENLEMSLPRVGITMGDAAGIGPEIVLKSLSDKNIFKVCQPVIIGDSRILLQTARDLEIDAEFMTVKKGAEIPLNSDTVIIYDLANIAEEINYGEESAAAGKASAEYIEEAVQLWQTGQINAIATAPISKMAIHLGGYNFRGSVPST